MTEQERRDRIVAAAERRAAALKAIRGMLSADHGYQAASSELTAANAALAEACQPIEPPYKPLLDQVTLQHIWDDYDVHAQMLRMAGAATLEALAHNIEGGLISADELRQVAKKERNHA